FTLELFLESIGNRHRRRPFLAATDEDNDRAILVRWPFLSTDPASLSLADAGVAAGAPGRASALGHILVDVLGDRVQRASL
ncbi:hypothetical protein, partial [Streptococcus pneumoniae]|uniref:hypothetical protein n=1 Tax=Streptococcus pneumoniae TaxID=1313 RepID=UPI001954A1CC